MSINYLHFGAPKMWYIISPKDQAKFERMAEGIFPELRQVICGGDLWAESILKSMMENSHLRLTFPAAVDTQACPAFIRHKDVMLSPALLRAHGIPFMQARQEEGQFIVLNASAYHW